MFHIINLDLLRFISLLVISLLVSTAARFLYHGLLARKQFLKLKANGTPIPEPHSLLFGHLLLCKKLLCSLPRDAHNSYWQFHLVRNWQQIFPGLTECPPLIYLDLWPIAGSMAIAINPEMCERLTLLPRTQMMRFTLHPLTAGLDMISASKEDHRLWRSRLNPGFSPRNLMDNLPKLNEECDAFLDILRAYAGRNVNWGEIFTLYNRVVTLTFCIFCRVSLGLKIGNQQDGPSGFKLSLTNILKYVTVDDIWQMLLRLSPTAKRNIARGTSIMNDILRPHLEAQIKASPDSCRGPKTIVDLALKEIRSSSSTAGKGESTHLNSRTIDIIMAQPKVFVFAGHDTTSINICWAYHHLAKTPDALAKLRAEHDRVLGSDPKAAAEVLRLDPYKINELIYTNAVVKETLRLHHTSMNTREGTTECSLTHAGIEYPTEGFDIWLGIMSTQTRPDLWPRADDFLPERHLVSEGNPLYPAKFAWRPFETGTYNCIGQELAMIELRLVLAMAVREFDFDFPWDE